MLKVLEEPLLTVAAQGNVDSLHRMRILVNHALDLPTLWPVDSLRLLSKFRVADVELRCGAPPVDAPNLSIWCSEFSNRLSVPLHVRNNTQGLLACLLLRFIEVVESERYCLLRL